MKKVIIIILIFLLFICSFSLKDYSEIGQISIASTLFIEEENNVFSVTVQIVEKYDQKNESVTATGKTPNECIEKINGTLVKKLSLSHCAVTVIGTTASSRGLSEIMNFLKNYNKFPLTSNMIFSDNITAFINKGTSYDLSEYLINKNHACPLYSVLNNAYSFKKINLPLIRCNKNGYEKIGSIEKEVSF